MNNPAPNTPDAAPPFPHTNAFTAPPITVIPEWIDFNGHLNVAFYSRIFDIALDEIFDHVGIGADYTKSHNSGTFILESHVRFLRELKQGEQARVVVRILNHDEKRIHLFSHMYHNSQRWLAASQEQVTVHVNLNQRKSSPFPEFANNIFAKLVRAQNNSPPPTKPNGFTGLHKRSP